MVSTAQEENLLSIWFEGFLYGKISVLMCFNWQLVYPMVKKLNFSTCLLGLYSGIFAMYLQCQSNKSRTTTTQAGVLFYALCLLYVLSTATFVCDIVNFVLSVSNDSICKIIYLFISCTVACRRTTIASKFN